MRIAYCLDNMGVGGTELNALRSAEALDRQRFEPMVVCFRDDGPLAARFKAAGIPLVRYRVGRLGSPRMLVQTARFARLLRRERIALVHCHDRYSNPFGVAAARLVGTPVIASKRWGEATSRHRIANSIAFRNADAVIGNSPSVVESLRRDDCVNPARIHLVPNFVDDSAFVPLDSVRRTELMAELGVREGEPLVGIIASLRPIKNHQLLLRAFALLVPRIPGVRLVLVGEGESRGALEALCEELGIGAQVRFAGMRPNTPNLHHLFDVSVLCSRTEGFPNSIVEAMAAGRPVVATDVVGIRDAVRHEETGLLVPDGEPTALATALQRVLSDPGLALKLGGRGREWSSEAFRATTVITQLQALYESVVCGRRS